MADFPSDSEDDNLSDSDHHFESDQEDGEAKNGKQKSKSKCTKTNDNDGPSCLPAFDSPAQRDQPEIGRPIHYFQTYFQMNCLTR